MTTTSGPRHTTSETKQATTERRRSTRRQVSHPVAFRVMEGGLSGQTLNISREGVLIRASGELAVVLSMGDREMRGRLVRVSPLEQGDSAYAIALDAPLPEPLL